jgi:hypothetical protein
MLHLAYRALNLRLDALIHPFIGSLRTTYKKAINNYLTLWRIFHLVCLFLLPIFRLRLGFAIYYSIKQTEIFFIAKYF